MDHYIEAESLAACASDNLFQASRETTSIWAYPFKS